MTQSGTFGVENTLAEVDWNGVEESLGARGFAHLPGILSPGACDALIAGFDGPESAFRKTVVMEEKRYGRGAYKYYAYPLPPILQAVREKAYEPLARVANTWMTQLREATRFPDTLEELLTRCREAGQDKPTALILRYGERGHNAMHQDLYGQVYFPMQAVLLLSEPGQDFTGGEFVLTQQIPGGPSTAMVVQPRKGDMVIFPTSFRPVQEGSTYLKAQLQHGVSEVFGGLRHTAGIIFHDALS